MSRPSAQLHTVDNSFGWFLKTLDSAFHIASKEKLSSIYIVIHKQRKPHTLFSVLRTITRKLIGFISNGSIIHNLASYKSNVSRNNVNKLTSDRSIHSHYLKLLAGDIKMFSVSNGIESVHVSISYLSFPRVLLHYIYAYFLSSFFFVQLLFKGKPVEILNLHYKGFNIGLFSAAHYVRNLFSLPTLRINLRIHYSIFTTIFNLLCFDRGFCISTKSDLYNHSYVICPDYMYPSGVLLKLALQYNFIILAHCRDNVGYSLELNENILQHELDISKSHDSYSRKLLNPSFDQDSVIKYLEKRTSSLETLPYMSFLRTSSSSVTHDFGISTELTNSDNVIAFVFLSAFTDAQYKSFDGYHSMLQWTLSTIKCLITNPYVQQIVIKFHPNTNFAFADSCESAVEKFFRNYPFRSHKILFVDDNFLPSMLTSYPQSVCITHHGSVAEESCFLKIPTIVSKHSAWAVSPPFCYLWSQPEVYEEFLSTFTFPIVQGFLDNTNLLLSVYHRHLVFPSYMHRESLLVWAFSEHNIIVADLSPKDLNTTHADMFAEVSKMSLTEFDLFLRVTTSRQIIDAYYLSITPAL